MQRGIGVLPAKRKPQLYAIQVSGSELVKGVRLINLHQYKRGIRVLSTRAGFRNAMAGIVQEIIRKESAGLLKKDTATSFEGGKSLHDMPAFSWDNMFFTLQYHCPMLTNALVGSVTSKKSAKHMGPASNTVRSVKPTIGTLASIIMYMRKSTMKYFQDMNSLLMWLSSCKRELFVSFNHLGLCTGLTATITSLGIIRKRYDDDVYGWKTEVVDYLSGMTLSGDTEETIPYCVTDADVTDVAEDISMVHRDNILLCEY